MLRGDLMIPFVQYYPDHFSAPIASTTTVRLFVSLKANINLCMDHFDITAASLHEAFDYDKTVYKIEMSRSNGYYRHGKQ